MRRIHLFAALASLWLAGSAQAESLDEAGDRIARALHAAETQNLFDAYTRKSNPYSRLSPELSDLIRSEKGLETEALADKAARLDMDLQGRDIAVRLWAAGDQDIEDLRGKVARFGGTVEEEAGGAIYARLPIATLEDMNDLDTLAFAEPQMTYRALQWKAGQIGEGVRSSGVEKLHQSGVTGKNVKIGILDFGFAGYDALHARGAVPRPVAVRAFNTSGDLRGGGVVHGTACAEIIHDMAPAAQLYLASVGQGGSSSDGDIIRAARWLAEQGVDIINFSGGGHGGPKNGTAPLDQLVDEISRQGILWTISAGNEGGSHWLGLTQDRNRDGLVDVPGNARGDFLLIEHQGGPLRIIVSWDDWGSPGGPPSASTDIDAYLMKVAPNGQAVMVGQSTNPQNGRGRPVEMLGGQAPAGEYGLVLKSGTLNSARPLHVVIQGARAFLPKEPTGSLGSPGTASSALTVGAVHAVQQTLEPYSSHGPTDDGRVKPEIVAPANNSSLSYASQGGRFPGTSAAAPHVAGFAALIKQARPDLDQPALRAATIAAVREMERPAPNNRVGHGHIDGGKVRVASANPEANPPSDDRPPPQGRPPTTGGDEDRLRIIAPLLDLLGK